MARPMRNVMLAAGVMFFFLWDGLFNRGHYLDVTVRTVRGLFSYFGVS